MLTLKLPDGSKREFPKSLTGAEFAASIGVGLAKAALAVRINGQLKDLSTLIDQDADVAIITRDSKEGLEVIRHDPLRLFTATAQFFWETARLDRRRAVASARLHLPLFVAQGSADAMMNVPRTRRWFDRLPTPDKTYAAYPGAGHTLDFEADRDAYLDDLWSWLCRR